MSSLLTSKDKNFKNVSPIEKLFHSPASFTQTREEKKNL